jgi:hypothetical protein
MRGGLTLTLLVVAASFRGVSATEEPSRSEEAPLELLRSTDMAERIRATNAVLRERRVVVEGLISIVRSSKDDENAPDIEIGREQSAKHLAMSLLGELRAEEAVGVLTANLLYRVKPTRGGTSEISIAGRYPAARALWQIGSPAVPEVMGRLLVSRNPAERHICLWLLVKIEGRHVAKFRVESALQAREPQYDKANLREALKWFDKEHSDYILPEESEQSEDKPVEPDRVPTFP